MMNDSLMRDDMDRLEKTVHRVFARVSVLEARLRELERELEATKQRDPRALDRPQLVASLARTA